MRKITGLNELMKDFKGNIIVMGNNQTTSMRDIITTHLGMWGSKEKDKTIKAYSLGIKINNCEEDHIFLEDAEYQILIEAIVKEPKMSTFAMGPVIFMLDNSEVVDPNNPK